MLDDEPPLCRYSEYATEQELFSAFDRAAGALAH